MTEYQSSIVRVCSKDGDTVNCVAHSTRPYNSPLRDAQADQTRVLILEALVTLVDRGPIDTLSVRELAKQAGVSERTVYRHFPDRASLLEGLAEWITERMGTGAAEEGLDDIDDIIDVVPLVFQRFDAESDAARAACLLRPDPARPTDDSRRRTRRMGRAVARSLPDLSPTEQHQFLALLRVLVGSSTWLRMREEFGLSGPESGALVSWALSTLFADVRRRGQLWPNRPADQHE